MEIDLAVPPLRNKLMKLLADHVITDQESRDQVIQLIDMLESFPLISKDNEDRHLTRVLDLVYEAEDITDEFILTTQVQRQKRSIQWPSRQNQKNYTDLLETINSSFRDTRMDLERSERSSEDQIVPTENTVRWKNNPLNLDEASYIVDRKSENDDLVRRLLDYKDSVIPVVGVAGSGKTTLVRNIYNSVDIKKHFQCRAWVYVSKELQEGNLLVDLLKQVTVEMTTKQELPNNDLKTKLHTSLKNKTYLIVLDGVNTTDVWDSLREALPDLDTEKGRKIILTTVNADVAKQSNPNISAFQLRPLTKEESWALFLNKVQVRVAQQGNPEILPSQLYLLTTKEMWPLLSKKLTAIEDHDFKMPDFVHLREEILRSCKGVPLAIHLLGELLSTINLTGWARVIAHATSGKYTTAVSGILAMSYQRLRYELKSCLLYMFLFPREYEIPVRRLFGLWISEDMVKISRSQERVAEDVALIYLTELVGRNMIQVVKWRSDGRPKACRMPVIVYDSLLPKASEMRFLCFQNSTLSKARRCANYVDVRRHPSYTESLRSYVSFDSRKRGLPTLEISMLLMKITGKRSFGLLTVLDLEGVYKPVLSKALGKLLLVRYLGLRSTVIDSLPTSVGELQCLETLDVKHTNITSLPSSILKGKKLQHLYLNGINLDMSIDGSVAGLQTLSGISICNKDSIGNGLDRYTSLRKLRLTCHTSAMEPVVDWISRLTNLRTLKLRLVETFLKPSDSELKLQIKKHEKLSHLYIHGKAVLCELPENLEILTLSLSSLKEDSMTVLRGLHQLKTLKLLAKSYQGKKMNCYSGNFPQLRILKLWMLVELEEWIMEEGAMPSLRELEIRRCENLKVLVGLQHVATLKELILTNMPENFVADIGKRSDVFVNINKLKLSASDLWLI